MSVHHEEKAAGQIVYCLDFDGVLCDSIDESLLISYSAYFDEAAGSIPEIDPALRDFFYEHRHMVRPAEEYHVLYYAYDNGERTVSPERFAELKAAMPAKMKEHAERFYKYRGQLQKDRDSWLGLHRIYPECVDFLERRQPFFIVSNKDRESIEMLTRHYGYSDSIRAIYSRELAIKKKVLLEKLFHEQDLDPTASRIVFVDDHEGTLQELQAMPLDLYLAAWGYTKGRHEGPFRLIHSLGELP